MCEALEATRYCYVCVFLVVFTEIIQKCIILKATFPLVRISRAKDFSILACFPPILLEYQNQPTKTI